MTTLIVIQLILAVALVILVLLQGSDNEGLGLGGGTFGGMMSARGSANHQNALIAYEPVWAIGTGLTPTLDEINQVHELIKNFDIKFRSFKVLYGGSVKSSNSKEITNLSLVDGCLVGGASLKVDEFNTIIS